MNVSVATGNPIKIEAVRDVFTRFFPESVVRVQACAMEGDLPEQPIGEQTTAGAIERARVAAKRNGADLGVGIEAGLVRIPGNERWVSIQVCAIADRAGRIWIGLGPGYELPEAVRNAVLAGEPLRDAFTRVLGVEDADRRGAVYHLSERRVDRRELTERAVEMALVSRMSTMDL